MYLIVIFSTLFFYWLFLRTRKPKKFPPGPPRLPVLGSLPFIGVKGSFVHSLKYVANKYGPVSGIFLGNMPAVIISDYNLIKGKLRAIKKVTPLFAHFRPSYPATRHDGTYCSYILYVIFEFSFIF